MPLYNKGVSPLERALNQGIDTSASAGANITQKKPESKLNSGDLVTGLAAINAAGQGNAIAGGIGSLVGGPNMNVGSALGYKFGEKASNPWEAFISGGVGANEEGMFSVFSGKGVSPATFIPQDPVSNFVSGGISGLVGFLF